MADVVSGLTAALADRYRIERELGRGGMATVSFTRVIHRCVCAVVVVTHLGCIMGRVQTTASIEPQAEGGVGKTPLVLGQRVRIEHGLAAAQETVGDLWGMRADTVVVAMADGSMAPIIRSSIWQFACKRGTHGHAETGVLIGGAIGLAFGGVVGAGFLLSDDGCWGDCGAWAAGAASAGLIMGMLGGLAVGVMIRSEEWVIVPLEALPDSLLPAF